MMGYTKLFSELIGSTIWREPDHVRLVWITMLACRDAKDTVQASIPGLADFARVPIDKCEDALAKLSAPDPYSRTTAHEGRRIEKCEGGWFILNAEKYRKKMNADERREYKRLKAREYRARNKSVEKRGQTGTEIDNVDTVRERVKEREDKEGATAPRLWDLGRFILGGPLLGKVLKEHGEEKVKHALMQTLLKDPADPKTYILGCLKEDHGESESTSRRLSAVEATDAGIARYLKRKGAISGTA